MKTADKVLIWLFFTDDTGLAMVVVTASDLGDECLLFVLCSVRLFDFLVSFVHILGCLVTGLIEHFLV